MLTRCALLTAGGPGQTGLGVMGSISPGQPEALRHHMGRVIDGRPSEKVFVRIRRPP